MANWVRFADTKATILFAGLGVALTMMMSKAPTIVDATKTGCKSACAVGILVALTGAALLWTLGWLVAVIGPRRRIAYARLNRFAWPSLVSATVADIDEHAATARLQDDAWQQVLDLSRLAEKKFGACGMAVWGFAAFVVFGVCCVIVATWVTA
ncbi:hypothetical protein [Nocardioides sp. 616]|uniref:hypothetical protein n=1 Tax=Nocardioides sp. 616 TaxID=2268090 RepID=UPI000CE50A88|nr:hypothetical protein [Nocardioides sp. 616]